MTDIQKLLTERSTTHGSFKDHAQVTQELKEVMHTSPKWRDLSASKMEALEMIVHKISRVLCGNPEHLDHWIDIVGYATLVAEELHLPQVAPTIT